MQAGTEKQDKPRQLTRKEARSPAPSSWESHYQSIQSIQKKGRGIKQSNLFRKFSRNTDSTDESSHGRPPGVLQTPCVEKGYRQQQKQDKKQNLQTVQAIKKTRKKRSSRAFSKNAEQHKGGNVSLSPPLTEDTSNESSFAKRQKGR